MRKIEAKIEIVNNFRAKISGKFPISVVDEALSYRMKNYMFSSRFKSGRWDGYVRFLRRPTNSFPAGFVQTVEEALKLHGKAKKRNVIVDIVDKRKAPEVKKLDLKVKDIDLYDFQMEAGFAALSAERGIIKIATNGGKTIIAAAMINYLGLNTLFLVPGLDLLVQTKDRLAKYLDTEIGQIGGGVWEPKAITVSTPDTLYTHLFPNLKRKNLRDEKRTELITRIKDAKAFLDTIDCLFIDECHHAASDKFFKVIAKCNAYYRFGMSGTPLDRTDEKDMKLIAQTGSVVVDVSNKDLIKWGYSSEAELHWIYIREPELDGMLNNYQDAYKYGIEKNKLRNSIVAKVVKELVDEGRGCMVTVLRRNHGREITKLIEAQGVRVEYLDGENDVKTERKPTLEKFRSGELKALVTTVIFNQGIDVHNIDGIVNAGGGKSKIAVLQRIGRGLRRGSAKKLIFVEFCDLTHTYLTRHSLERLSVYKKEGCFRIVKKDIT